MAHLHEMRDSDNHFIIDPVTMAITNNSAKHTLQQGDHNCEIYSFELPRLIEGHDMTLCNLVQIHYINIKGDKTEQSKDVYTVTDMAVSVDDPDTLIFTWTVHGNATKYAGSLNFRIHFNCIDDYGEYTYKKHTEIFKGITISEGFDNAESVEEDHSDILSVWEARMDALEKNESSSNVTNEKYFEIDYDGVISLKPEYRADGAQNEELPEVIVIPDVINDIAVSALSESMFAKNHRVKSLTIPSSVTAIPTKFAFEAINLEKINGTENIETIGKTAFGRCGIRKALFPNLQKFDEITQFTQAANLAIVDIGNAVSAIPTSCFSSCDKLSLIRGGANVTEVGDNAFYGTRSLKNLPLVDNVTSIGSTAFLLSRVNYDWWTFKSTSGCTFGTDATPAHFNPSNWWTGCTYTACENPLGSTFHQRNPEWASEYLPNSVDTYREGCVEISTAHIYSALSGVELSSPIAFVNLVDESLYTPSGTLTNGNVYTFEDMGEWLESLGLECEIVQYGSTENLQKIYDALSDGALVLTNINPSHAAVIYGIADNGELLLLDSQGFNHNLQDYTARTFQQPIWSFALASARAMIVKKPEDV